LAGIPITAGFFAKFFLFQSVMATSNQYLWLVIVALINSTVSLYYYLNVIRLMVIGEPSESVEKLSTTDKQILPSPVATAIAFSLVGTLLLGFFADPMMDISRKAVSQIREVPPPQIPMQQVVSLAK
jgi:NADH:ubiquinone oxidoreductase subunit 2 (subunit N)